MKKIIINTDYDKLKPKPSIIARGGGDTIAYNSISGKSPGLIFLSGFKSDMYGLKASAIHKFCEGRGHSFLRFDYSGHGQSSGKFENGTIGSWLDDALFVIDNLTSGPQILIGSSMGGWIMLLVALKRPDRIIGIIGLAAAPDFTEDLIWSSLNPSQKKHIKKVGYLDIKNTYEDQSPYRITYNLINEARNHLILGAPILIEVPVYLIHGEKDEDVPFMTSLKLARCLKSEKVHVHLIKSADHRLSREVDLEVLIRAIKLFLDLC